MEIIKTTRRKRNSRKSRRNVKKTKKTRRQMSMFRKVQKVIAQDFKKMMKGGAIRDINSPTGVQLQTAAAVAGVNIDGTFTTGAEPVAHGIAAVSGNSTRHLFGFNNQQPQSLRTVVTLPDFTAPQITNFETDGNQRNGAELWWVYCTGGADGQAQAADTGPNRRTRANTILDALYRKYATQVEMATSTAVNVARLSSWITQIPP